MPLEPRPELFGRALEELVACEQDERPPAGLLDVLRQLLQDSFFVLGRQGRRVGKRPEQVQFGLAA